MSMYKYNEMPGTTSDIIKGINKIEHARTRRHYLP